MGMRCFRNRFPVPTTQKTEKPVMGVQPMNQASAPWPSYIRRCCSILGPSGNKKESPFMSRLRANFSQLAYPMQDAHIKVRKFLRALFLIAFLSSVLVLAFSSIFHRPILEEGGYEKREFPDVSSFPCHSPYRGYGGWQSGNRMHHLMRSFHPSTINIV